MQAQGAVTPVSQPARLIEPFGFAQATADEFDDALTNAVRDNAKSMSDLHTAVGNCVATLRAEGMLCEAVLLTMKAYTKHIAHGPEGDPYTSAARTWAVEVLVDQVARWSIKDFYEQA